MGFYTDRGYSLQQAKDTCLLEVESWYGGKVLDVFDTDQGLNSLYRYECNEAAQLRMVNGKISNTSVQLMCGPVPQDPETDPNYSWVTHTSVEAGKVHTAYMNFTQSITTQYNNYKTQVNNATTVAEVDAVFFSLYGV